MNKTKLPRPDAEFWRSASPLISYFIYKRVNNIIAISHSVKKFLIDSSFHEIKSKIRVVYYGLDDFYIQKCLTNNQKINIKKNHELIFGFIGRLVKQKQVDKLILSFKEYINETNVLPQKAWGIQLLYLL